MVNTKPDKCNREEITSLVRASEHPDVAAGEIDLSLLKDSLAKTPWERMQANDDALRFADSLRAAMEKRNAKSQRVDSQTH
jgi:hypothetical protein